MYDRLFDQGNQVVGRVPHDGCPAAAPRCGDGQVGRQQVLPGWLVFDCEVGDEMRVVTDEVGCPVLVYEDGSREAFRDYLDVVPIIGEPTEEMVIVLVWPKAKSE
jgi:hypothetical protein